MVVDGANLRDDRGMRRVFMVPLLCIGCAGSSESASDAAAAQQPDAGRECIGIEGRWGPEDEAIDCRDLVFEGGSYRMEECAKEPLANGYYELERDGCGGVLIPAYPKLLAHWFSIEGSRMTISEDASTDELYYVWRSDLTALP